MLHFVVGIAGTGKTSNIMEKMHALAEKGERLIYLVPEQYSFEAERHVNGRLGGRLALNVEVLSFTRLSGSVFRAYGGLSGVVLDKAGKYLLMSIALGETGDKLQIYRKSALDTSFIGTLVETCGEFKMAGVTHTALEQFSKVCADDVLAKKISDISVIYSAYQSLIARGYSDPDDDLLRAGALLENNDFFKGTTIFVDGFTTFMKAEFELLGHAIAGSKDIYFAMTADEVIDSRRGMGVFSPAISAMNRLARMAESRGVRVENPEILQKPVRFLKPELMFAAENFMQPSPPVYEGEYTGALAVFGARDKYGEMERVAAEITRLVREDNYRYREIAVIARDPAPYQTEAESAFSRCDIPYFMSIGEDVENKPLISCVLAALNAARKGFNTDDMMLFAKSPLLGLDAGDVAALENYCYCWSIRGALWQSDFTNNPRGLAGPLDEDDFALLKAINNTRSLIVTPLLNLREAMGKGDGKSFATGIFDFLNEINAAENLARYASCIAQSDAFLDESAQLWDSLMDVLDIFGGALGGYGMTGARMCELFGLAVNAKEISSPPQTLDQVLIGGADRIRPREIRAVFVIGANEDVFPAAAAAPGVFSDRERGELIAAGLEISAPMLQKSVLEKYFAYFALTLASERLYISYPKSDLKGRALLPSVIVSQIEEIFPGLPAPRPDMLDGISNEASAFEAFSLHYNEDSDFSASLHEFFKDGQYAGTVSRIDAAAKKEPRKIGDTTVAGELFGKFMRLSPSRVERFYKCPYSYFISDGLKIRKRQRVEFTGLESGSVIHHVLQVMVKRHGGKGLLKLSEKETSDEILAVVREYLDDKLDDPTKLPARLRFLFERLSGMLSRLLRRIGEEFDQSSFEPAEFEMPIGIGGKVEPLRLKTTDGADVVVEGIVDRVDVMNKNGRKYIRVVDYKSGVKSFALEDVLCGLNMQMLLYLFTIAENGAGSLSGAIPAGVLYMPASERYVSATRDADDEEAAKKHQRAWRMSGLLLDDEEALRGMERDIAGIYIPVKLDKTGKPDASSQLAGFEQMGLLSRKIKKQISEMARLLGQGDILVRPVESDGVLTCEYCDYSAVCGFEHGDEIRRIAKLDKDRIFELLQGEEQDASAMD